MAYSNDKSACPVSRLLPQISSHKHHLFSILIVTLFDWCQKNYKLIQCYIDAAVGRDCSIDCFISPNQFFDWRNTKQLASLHANWLEIDINSPPGTTREKKKYLNIEQEITVLNEISEQLSAQGVFKR